MPQSPISSNPGLKQNADGSFSRVPLLIGPNGALASASALAVLAGACFAATTPAAAAGTVTSVALATTYTGLVLSNPITSGVNLVVNRVSAGLMVAPATITTIGLFLGYNAATNVTHTTPGLVRKLNPASTVANVGVVDTSATLPTAPVWIDWLAQCPVATESPFESRAYDNLILPPGAYLGIGTNIASPAAGLAAAFQWTETVIPA